MRPRRELVAGAATFCSTRLAAVIETEEEVDMETVPTPARSAIQRRAAGGTISKVEKVTGAAISYEAAIRTKSGKNVEYAVNADGTLHKEN
jgi:hypothetical protein